MCGICGKVYLDGERRVEPGLIASMSQRLEHRGPDDEGVYVAGAVGLGHRRLSIIDLSTGKQPISNEDGTVWIVYNGEIYNYQELRSDLSSRGHVFSTATDTEVIVHLYEEYGEECLSRLRGMFAFALWDSRSNSLFLARDRVGIKPLYYYLDGDSLVFASEIKAILADPSVKKEIDLQGMNVFFTYYFAQGPHTLVKNLFKLPQGHYLTVKQGRTTIKQYWDLTFQNHPGSDLARSVGELNDLLRRTVKDHMISDVPVGFLLSGGVDSTGLLSYAVTETDKRISSFTLGFDGEGFADERTYARLAAKRFGTDHYEMSISAKDFLDFLPGYVWHMEEPVCDPSAIALYYVTKLAKDHVKVLISGEGGDEAFAGYQTYRNLVWLERVKKLLGPANLLVPAAFQGARGTFGALDHLKAFTRTSKYAPLMVLPLREYYYSRASNPFRFFNAHRDELFSREFLEAMDRGAARTAAMSYFVRSLNEHDLNKMLYVDTNTYLPDDLLIKADKMTMANSVELRVPLLDHKVLEFAAALPCNYKLRGLTTKYILKKTLEPVVPTEIVRRKKTGFPVPYERWLRRDLKGFVSELLLDRKSMQRGYLNRQNLLSFLSRNNNGSDYSPEVFCLVVLELWHRAFLDGQDHGGAHAAA